MIGTMISHILMLIPVINIIVGYLSWGFSGLLAGLVITVLILALRHIHKRQYPLCEELISLREQNNLLQSEKRDLNWKLTQTINENKDLEAENSSLHKDLCKEEAKRTRLKLKVIGLKDKLDKNAGPEQPEF